ncbi:MAG: hypothetical protein EOP49_00125 [Sphingobacteriales bacterium]|nr:MAG: hypothetical protein EOP49_00125 [Sphingobacteriales bacterium]
MIAKSIEAFLKSISNVSAKAELGEFRTIEWQFKKSIDRNLSLLDEEKLKKLFFEVLAEFDNKPFLKQEAKRTKSRIAARRKNSHFNAIWALISEAENKVANAGLAIFAKADVMHIPGKFLESADLIANQKKLKGEARARNTIRIFLEIAESVYKSYVEFLDLALQISEGQTSIKQGASFGVTVKRVAGKLEKRNASFLVDPDCSWLRNACAHGHWRYDPELKQIIIWDQRHPPVRISTEELYHRAITMSQTALCVHSDLWPLYLKNKILIQWEHFMPRLLEVLSTGGFDQLSEIDDTELLSNTKLSELGRITFTK